jgi:citrate lyase beta subunit
MHPYRSMLFVPGHKPAWADKALAAGADAIILDHGSAAVDFEGQHIDIAHVRTTEGVIAQDEALGL